VRLPGVGGLLLFAHPPEKFPFFPSWGKKIQGGPSEFHFRERLVPHRKKERRSIPRSNCSTIRGEKHTRCLGRPREEEGSLRNREFLFSVEGALMDF